MGLFLLLGLALAIITGLTGFHCWMYVVVEILKCSNEHQISVQHPQALHTLEEGHLQALVLGDRVQDPQPPPGLV
jgi:hypothetical protein